MHWLDLGFVATFAGAWPAYENFVRLPRVRAEIAAQGGPRRVREYRITMAQQWTLVALAFVLMAVSGRSWDSVGLVWPSGASLWWSGGALALIGVFLFVQHRAATGSEAARAAVARQLVPLRWILPASPPELANFRALSVTAGVCEEILFRGYLMAFLLPFVGTGGAVVVSSLLFGLAHAYQGFGGTVKTTVVGFLMAGLYLLTGSLLAPILVHALVDVASGQIAAEVPAGARPWSVTTVRLEAHGLGRNQLVPEQVVLGKLLWRNMRMPGRARRRACLSNGGATSSACRGLRGSSPAPVGWSRT